MILAPNWRILGSPAEVTTPKVLAALTFEPVYTKDQIGGLLLNRIVFISVLCFVAAQALTHAQTKADAEKLAHALKGDTAGAAANNKVCQMFTNSEASYYIGQPVNHLENAAMGTGCQWSQTGVNGSMLVQIVPARYHERPSGAPGYKKLPDIDPQAFVVPETGGWHAGAVQKPHAVHVNVSGKGASEAKAVELLKASLKRDAATATP